MRTVRKEETDKQTAASDQSLKFCATSIAGTQAKTPPPIKPVRTAFDTRPYVSFLYIREHKTLIPRCRGSIAVTVLTVVLPWRGRKNLLASEALRRSECRLPSHGTDWALHSAANSHQARRQRDRDDEGSMDPPRRKPEARQHKK